MERESSENIGRDNKKTVMEEERAAQRKIDYLRSFNIKLNIGGAALVLGLFTLLYFAGDFINSYVSVSWLVLVGLLVGIFYTLKYFYLAWFTDDDDY